MRDGKTDGGRGKGPRCPTCGRPRVPEYRPFCSRRCRDIDLGRWFQQAYTIPAVEADEDGAEPEPEEDDERDVR